MYVIFSGKHKFHVYKKIVVKKRRSKAVGKYNEVDSDDDESEEDDETADEGDGEDDDEIDKDAKKNDDEEDDQEGDMLNESFWGMSTQDKISA